MPGNVRCRVKGSRAFLISVTEEGAAVHHRFHNETAREWAKSGRVGTVQCSASNRPHETGGQSAETGRVE